MNEKNQSSSSNTSKIYKNPLNENTVALDVEIIGINCRDYSPSFFVRQCPFWEWRFIQMYTALICTLWEYIGWRRLFFSSFWLIELTDSNDISSFRTKKTRISLLLASQRLWRENPGLECGSLRAESNILSNRTSLLRHVFENHSVKFQKCFRHRGVWNHAWELWFNDNWLAVPCMGSFTGEKKYYSNDFFQSWKHLQRQMLVTQQYFHRYWTIW